nr:unnamed protein product [Digitaria exilis]
MQEPSSRNMSQENDGELAGVATSHDNDHHEHTIGGRDNNADAVDDKERGGGQAEESSGMDDARIEFPSSSSDDDGDADDDVRISFATAVGDGDGDQLVNEQAELDLEVEEEDDDDTSRYDYVTWMESEPVSIQERRRRLLQGMGLNSSRDLLRSRNSRPPPATTPRLIIPPDIPRSAPPRRPHHHPPPSTSSATDAAVADDATSAPTPTPATKTTTATATRQHPNDVAAVLTRSRSDSRLAVRAGGARKPARRVYSLPHSLNFPPVNKPSRRSLTSSSAAAKGAGIFHSGDTGGGGFFTSDKKQDTGKEFMLKNGQRSAPLSVEELERFIGKHLMRRSQSQPVPAGTTTTTTKEKKPPPEKKRTRWLKNIKLVASAAGLRHDKDVNGRSATTMSKSASVSSSSSSSTTGPERLKVHHYGKSSKELTGVYMRQEVRAHEGSIWSIKFSPDGRFLASAGEDHVVRVWKVVDVDGHDAGASSSSSSQEVSASVLPPQPPPATPTRTSMDAGGGRSSAAAPGLAAQLSRRMRRGRSGKDVLPEHVVVPENLFALAEKPAFAFEGHQDDVLDLSWSKSQCNDRRVTIVAWLQKLLSSSMDKTVRLWDMDTKTCLKMFPHNDYDDLSCMIGGVCAAMDAVTCVQFNPVDDDYFISGLLDCKVRIWSVPDRQVVDWSDVSDMVTAACYTPDGQEAQIDMSISKKRRTQAKKITGFQFAPGNPSEILVTSADSQIRVFNGITVLQKFKGFKNTSSQISASYTADGRHVVCASEDSNVYVWRRVPTTASSTSGTGAGGGGSIGIGVRAKTWLTSRSYEYFFCRDVSVAVPWPGSSPSPSPAFRCKSDGDTAKKKHGAAIAGDDDNAGVPPLPRRHKSGPMGYPGASQPDLCRRESSAAAASASARWHGGAEGGNAWGMVVVTASRGGEIRVYQNFGLPLGNIFH